MSQELQNQVIELKARSFDLIQQIENYAAANKDLTAAVQAIAQAVNIQAAEGEAVTLQSIVEAVVAAVGKTDAETQPE